MKGSLTESLIEFIKDLKMKAIDSRNQARDSLTIGNKQATESYLRYSRMFNTAANNLKKIYLDLKAYNSIVR